MSTRILLLGLIIIGIIVAALGAVALVVRRSHGTPPSTVITPGPAQAPASLPLRVTALTHAIGGGIRGFAVLGRFAAPGPQQVWVARTTRQPPREPYVPIAVVRVIDPTGHTAAAYEATDQTNGSAPQLITVPTGPAGIWRLSCTGGRQGDRWQVALPNSASWGVRGEMSLAWEHAPAQSWLWVPPSANRVLLEQFGGGSKPVVLRDAAGTALASCANHTGYGTRRVAVLDPAPGGSLLRVDLSAAPGAAILLDGVPGLLCPTQEAAKDLAGGTVVAAGLTTAGPLQARAREWMAKQTPASLVIAPEICSPSKDPVDDPREALLYGQYGPFTGLAGFISRQHLDPADPFCGTEIVAKPRQPAWSSFVYGPLAAPFQAKGLATLAALPAKRNRLCGNEALVRRATLAAFYHLASMSGEELTREEPLWDRPDCYPITHAFFVYEGSLASPYAMLAERLDPEARAIWRDGLLAIGDRLADHQGYQTNQWAHVLVSHLQTYRSTGEKRFLSYFHRLATALLDGTSGADSKFGQHPAGYYLEEYGCDGNYDNMDLTLVARMWLLYRDLPDADPQMEQRLRSSLERSTHFRSLLWLPLPGGNGITTPTAFNSRRPESSLAHSNPAGEYLLAGDLPLAAARVALTPEPANGVGNAGTFPYMAMTATWSKRLMASVPQAVTPSWSGGDLEMWNARGHSKHVAPAEIPARGPDGVWELPGLVAWKRGGLYGVVFHDVAGAAPNMTLKGVMGGGPTALWQAQTGPLVLSMAATQSEEGKNAASPVVASTVFGTTTGGAPWVSGKERSQLSWNEPGRDFSVRAQIQPIGGSLEWRYHLDDDSLRITIALTAPGAATAKVNLPLYGGPGAAQIDAQHPQQVTFVAGDTRVSLASTGATAALSEPLPTAVGETKVRCLRLDLPRDGKPVTITVRAPLPAAH